MEVKAVQKFVRMSPRKLRLVVPLVKNLSPTKALEVLPFTRKRAAGPLSKVIKTALANAKEKGISEADLIFKEIQINEGPRLKRWRAGARGRVKPYQRKMSHIRVILGTVKSQASSAKPKTRLKEKIKKIKATSKRKQKSKKNVKKE